MFQIVTIAPTRCYITDAVIGSHVLSRSHPYHTEALAHKLAGRMAARAYEYGDDELAFRVVPCGGCPFTQAVGRARPAQPTDACFDDMPF